MTNVRFTHVGGPTVLVEFSGWRILTDPTFDPPGRTYRFGWGTSSRKVSGPAIEPSDIGPLDAVLLTHDHHADNLDETGRGVLPAAGAVLTTETGAARIGGHARGLAPWATTTLSRADGPSLTVTATPCRHGPRGSHPIVGDVIGFALGWEGQTHGELWFSGDTVLYDGVRDVAGRVGVGTAIVHLGAVRFGLTGPVRYTMSAADAVELLRSIRPHTTIPVHYEGWSHFRQGRTAAERQFAAAPTVVRDAVRWTTIGEPTDIEV